MKKLEAIIKPFQLDEIKDALAEVQIHEIIVTDVRCSYNDEKDSESYLSDDYFVEFLPKIRIEMFIEDAKIAPVAELLKSIISSDAGAQNRIFASAVVEI